MITNTILMKQYVFCQYLSHANTKIQNHTKIQLKDLKNALNNMMDPTMQKLNLDFQPHYNCDELLTLYFSPLENPKTRFMV